MNKTFTAIDFETANYERSSICQVGLVRVENGIVVHKINKLVRPQPNYYLEWFTNDVHGISTEDTDDAPVFSDIWEEIFSYIEGQDVVAHNGFAFDFVCLSKTLEYYNIPVPEYKKHCTYKIFGENLEVLCDRYNIQLNHHNALSDAEACAVLFLKHLKNEFRNKQ